MADPIVVAPCEPPVAAAHQHGLGHGLGHGPGHVLGRIRRHGTVRIARRLREGAGCLPGAPVGALKQAMAPVGALKQAMAPAATIAATAALGAVAARDLVSPGSQNTGIGDPALQGRAPGGASGTVTPPRPHHIVALPEPASLPVLLLGVLGLLAWGGVRRWWKPG